MKTILCGNCGERANVVQKEYQFDETGIPVILHGIEVIECPHCGAIDPIIPSMNGLMDSLAIGVLCSPCKLTGGEVRFLRKYVNKSAREFARFLHVEHTHLSKIENGRLEIGNRTDKLVRMIVVGLTPKLEHEIKHLAEMMPDIEDTCPEEKPRIQIDVASGACQYV